MGILSIISFAVTESVRTLIPVRIAVKPEVMALTCLSWLESDLALLTKRMN